MPISQNARFTGACPPAPGPDDEHRLGSAIAQQLETALRSRGFAVEPYDLWRDVGWAVRVGQDLSVPQRRPQP